jgi:phenylacetic acid degradation operon negative regulatory protein
MRVNSILSTISRYPTSRLVFSSFGFYGRRRGGELPGVWLLEALGLLAVEPVTVRKTLYRLESSGELQSRKTARHKLYRPGPYMWAAIDAGAERLTTTPDPDWDGEWTVVHTGFRQDQRAEREQVRTVLGSEGFSTLGPGVYVRPRVRAGRLLDALEAGRLRHHVTVFRGRLESEEAPRLVARCWDLAGLSRRYSAFIRRYRPLLSDSLERRWAGADGLALKFAVVLDYLDIAWPDPELPMDLLPRGWPGDEARDLARALNGRLLPLAVELGDEVMARVLRHSPDLDVPSVRRSARASSGRVSS